MTSDELDAILDGLIPTLDERQADLLARVAAIEARPLPRDGRDGLPGVPGASGEKGIDGAAGRDGADGLGFDDLDLVIDEARKGCFLRFTRGDQVKEFRLPTPFDIGTYHDGEQYEKGNGVTWNGSWWLAKAPTTDKPGDGATAWRLTVKKGKDAKDGRDGAVGPPGPRGPGWQEEFDAKRRKP